MQLKKAIDKRKSIRSFQRKKVSKKIIKEIIKDACKAPSGKNEQPWRFYVVSKKEDINKVKNILQDHIKENKIDFNFLSPKIQNEAKNFYSNLGNPPIIIFIYRELKKNPPGYQFFNDVAGISCAIENLMLSVVDKGLGSCWVGSFKSKEKDISQLVKASKSQELMASLVIGYPKKGYMPLIRKKKKINEILKFV